MSTTIYGIDNAVTPAKRVASSWGNLIADTLELAAVQLARAWGAGCIGLADMVVSDGGSGAINVAAGTCIVGDPGSEKIKRLASVKTLPNPGNNTWYVYATQNDDSDGTPTFSVTTSATPAANTHQVGKAVIAAGTWSSGGSTPDLAPSRRNLKTVTIPLPLTAARLISSNDIPNSGAADGGTISKDTAPLLERVNAATDKALRIKWAASSVIEIQLGSFAYPADLDDTQPIYIRLLAKMSGGTNTPTIAVGYFEGVGDTNAGGNTAALSSSLQDLLVVIAAGDIGPAPSFATVTLIPGSHGTDTLDLYGARVEYQRR